MPTLAEIRQYLGGQTFGDPILPKVDLTGKTYVITGANTGLGLECAKHLANLKASKLILGCRSLTKGNAAKTSILALSPSTTVIVWAINQSSFPSVLAFGDRLKTLERLDGFVANAGLETVTFERTEGYENSLTVNVISTCLVAVLAIPKLRETAKRIGEKVNLVVVGSMQHVFAPSSELLVPITRERSILDALSVEKGANMQKRYELSKLMVQLCSKELASKISSSEIVVNCVNPGWCATELGRYYDKGRIVGAIFKMIGRTAEVGGRTLVHGVTAGQETHGEYLSECLVKREGEFVRGEEGGMVRKRLWGEVEGIIERVIPGACGLLDV